MQDLLPWAVWAFELAALAFTFAGAWRTFAKAGAPGWAALIPLWNLVVLLRVARRPAWPWILALIVPGVNLVGVFAVAFQVARRFGHGRLLGAALVLAPFVAWPLLGFGASRVKA